MTPPPEPPTPKPSRATSLAHLQRPIEAVATSRTTLVRPADVRDGRAPHQPFSVLLRLETVAHRWDALGRPVDAVAYNKYDWMLFLSYTAENAPNIVPSPVAQAWLLASCQHPSKAGMLHEMLFDPDCCECGARRIASDMTNCVGCTRLICGNCDSRGAVTRFPGSQSVFCYCGFERVGFDAAYRWTPLVDAGDLAWRPAGWRPATNAGNASTA